MDKSEWQGAQGEIWAREWRRTDRGFAAVTQRLLDEVGMRDFSSVLDIGCGAGELSLAIAGLRPDAHVIGVDVSPQLVAAASDRGGDIANAAFELGDAAVWSPPAGFTPQLLVSRHGVMFFDDPVAAFAHLADIAATGAQLLFSCFRAPEFNPFFTEILALLPEPPAPPPPGAPGPFAFADREHVAGILSSGGWDEIAFDAIDFPMIVGEGENAVEEAVAYFSSIGPAARIAAEMDDDGRQNFFEGLRQLAERLLANEVVSLPAAGWIVSARKA